MQSRKKIIDLIWSIFIVSTFEQEIKFFGTEFRYQLPSLASFIGPARLRVEQQKSKMELETKVLKFWEPSC